MQLTCDICGESIIFDATDGPTHGSPEHHDNKLSLEGDRVGTAFDTGEVWCGPCEEEN